MSGVDVNAAILGGIKSLVAFAPGVPKQECSDILNVLSYAQMYAGHTYDFYNNWHLWFHYYRNRLESRSFQLENVLKGNSVVLGSVEDLHRATFTVSGGAASKQLVDLVRRSFDAMGIYEITKTYFEGGIDTGRFGSFQIVPCEKNASGNVSLLLCGLHLSVDDFSADRRRLILHFKGGSYNFDSDAYAKHRDSDLDYLIKNGIASIKDTRI